jgi:tetratricopeptide (TPR) repeat protein
MGRARARRGRGNASQGDTAMLSNLIRSVFKRGVPLSELNALALAHYEKGEIEQAERYFLEVANRSPADVQAWINVAATLLNQEKHASALPVLLKIVDLAPDLAAARLDLGTCYNRLGRNEEAIGHYHRALEHDPDLHKAHANVINAYLDICDWTAVDRWVAAFTRYRESHPRALWAQRLQPFGALTLFPGRIAKELAIHYAGEIASGAQARFTPEPARPGRK